MTTARGLIHGRNVPPPFTVACLNPRRRPKEYALGHRFGVFKADPLRVERVLVASFPTDLEAYEHAWGLVRDAEREPTVEADPIDDAITAQLRAAREAAGARCG